VKVSDALALVAVSCALITTGLVVRRELVTRETSTLSTGRPVANVDALISSAFHVSGAPDAPTTVVEFFDLQCPACRRFSLTIDSVMLRHPRGLRIARHHFPLSVLHPRAQELALAGLCLGNSPAFEAYYHRAFAIQGQLSSEFGSDPLSLMPAGTDTAKLRRCMRSSKTWDDLSRELALADSLHLPGTPSFIVNGRLYSGSRDVRRFEALLGRNFK
jgi:protein-disulfide isomerase